MELSVAALHIMALWCTLPHFCLMCAHRHPLICSLWPRVQADRSLKKDSANIVTRVKCDIKDFDPRGVEALWSEQQGTAPAEAGQPPLSSTSGISGTGDGENAGTGHGEGAASASASASPKPWLAVGKHLCGSATDFTIRCCRRHMVPSAGDGAAPGPEEAEEGSAPLQPACVGLAVATCCHHRCTWKHYVAQDFFTSCGFTPEVNEGALTLLRRPMN